jgi:hypothetical protein
LLPNVDFDTGKPTQAAEYSLTDDAYAKLLGQLSGRKFDLTSPDLRDNILQFYSDLSVPIETKKDKNRWQSVLASLDQLKLVTTPAPTVAEGHAQSAPSARSEGVTAPLNTPPHLPQVMPSGSSQ